MSLLPCGSVPSLLLGEFMTWRGKKFKILIRGVTPQNVLTPNALLFAPSAAVFSYTPVIHRDTTPTCYGASQPPHPQRQLPDYKWFQQVAPPLAGFAPLEHAHNEAPHTGGGKGWSPGEICLVETSVAVPAPHCVYLGGLNVLERAPNPDWELGLVWEGLRSVEKNRGSSTRKERKDPRKRPARETSRFLCSSTSSTIKWVQGKRYCFVIAN